MGIWINMYFVIYRFMKNILSWTTYDILILYFPIVVQMLIFFSALLLHPYISMNLLIGYHFVQNVRQQYYKLIFGNAIYNFK